MPEDCLNTMNSHIASSRASMLQIPPAPQTTPSQRIEHALKLLEASEAILSKSGDTPAWSKFCQAQQELREALRKIRTTN